MTRAPMETQPERTVLSWQRTGFGVLAVAGLVGHRALVDGDPVLFLLGGVVALLGLVLLGGVAPLRYRRLRRTIGRGPTSAPALAALATLVVLAAGGAAVTVITAA